MSGIADLEQLVRALSPELMADEFVFCTVADSWRDRHQLNPIATFQEREGVSLVLTKREADSNALDYTGVFRQITLNVHSSLAAVGLTAKVTETLAAGGISANVIAAFHHDHLFVPAAEAADALAALQTLALDRALPPGAVR